MVVHDGVTETRLTVGDGEVSFSSGTALYFGRDDEGPVIASDAGTVRLFLGRDAQISSATSGCLSTTAFEIEPSS